MAIPKYDFFKFPSHSNTNDFEHLVNLKEWMTASLKTETDSYITRETAKIIGNEDYLAVTSQMLAQSVTDLNSTESTVKITLQRTERNESTETDKYFQDLILNLKKVEEKWLVNSAVWQEKTEI